MKKIILLIVFMSIIGCIEQKKCDVSMFNKGDIVKSVIGNHTGQILDVTKGIDCKYYYNVRFNIKSYKTNTRLLDNDDDIETGLSLIKYMEVFELKRVND